MNPNNNQSNLTEWTAGFFDGDGCLSMHVTKSESSKIGYETGPRVHVANSYVPGFFDAEGCINLGIKEHENSTIGYRVSPGAIVNHTDHQSPVKELLCEYADHLGIKYTIEDKDAHNDRSSPFFSFRVYELESIEEFVSTLYPHLVVKKPQAKILLEDIIPVMKRGEHTGRRGFLKVMHYKEKMDSMKGGTRGKYDLEYFEDMWGMEYNP